jgi:hypothetical protein
MQVLEQNAARRMLLVLELSLERDLRPKGRVCSRMPFSYPTPVP